MPDEQVPLEGGWSRK